MKNLKNPWEPVQPISLLRTFITRASIKMKVLKAGTILLLFVFAGMQSCNKSEIEPELIAEPEPIPIAEDTTLVTQNAAFSKRGGHTSLAFEDKIWVIGGAEENNVYKNDVWSSSNGSDWVNTGSGSFFKGRVGHTSVVFNNLLWVIGGVYDVVDQSFYNNDVWFSPDGSTWAEATGAAAFSKRWNHASVVFDNKIWVIGGFDESQGAVAADVWYSANGIIWEQATSKAEFTPRFWHTVVIFDSRMWVIGGMDDSGLGTNDVWSSTDGITWDKVVSATGFAERFGHTSVVFDDKIWVIGGISTSGNAFNYLNDVWYSPDGTTWVEATDAPNFSARFGHASVVHKNKIWIIGGGDENKEPMNDVWAFD